MGLTLLAGIGVGIPFIKVFKVVMGDTDYSIVPLITLFYSLAFTMSVFHSIGYF